METYSVIFKSLQIHVVKKLNKLSAFAISFGGHYGSLEHLEHLEHFYGIWKFLEHLEHLEHMEQL